MKITHVQEKKLVFALCKTVGMSDEHADVMAKEITYSDLTGVYSHGISRFANYYKHNKRGTQNPKPNMKFVHDGGSTLVLDVDNATGVLGMAHMYNTLKDRAKKYGIAMGVCFNSTNIGCAAYYSKLAVDDSLACICGSNTGPLMAPIGGRERMMGTEPISIGIPAGKEKPMILDMATSVAAYGKIQAAAREGKSIPEGWALDKEGNPTTDPNNFYSLIPFGGAKGYCLAVMIDALGCFFSGAATGHKVGWNPAGEMERSGAFMILIDPAAFRPIEDFKADVDWYIRDFKGSKKAPGVEEIFMPGEIEANKLENYKKNGIELPPNLCAELAGLAIENGIAPEGSTLEDVVAILDKQ